MIFMNPLVRLATSLVFHAISQPSSSSKWLLLEQRSTISSLLPNARLLVREAYFTFMVHHWDHLPVSTVGLWIWWVRSSTFLPPNHANRLVQWMVDETVALEELPASVLSLWSCLGFPIGTDLPEALVADQHVCPILSAQSCCHVLLARASFRCMKFLSCWGMSVSDCHL